MDLRGGGLCAKEDISVDIEGVLLVLGGVVRRNVEGLKVVVVALDLGAFNDLVAHADKDALHLLEGDHIGVAVAHGKAFGREGDVDGLRRQALLLYPSLDGLLGFRDGFLDLHADVIDHLTDGRTLLGGDVLHALEDLLEAAFLAEDTDADLIDPVERVGLRNMLLRFLSDFFQFFFDHTDILLIAG